MHINPLRLIQDALSVFRDSIISHLVRFIRFRPEIYSLVDFRQRKVYSELG